MAGSSSKDSTCCWCLRRCGMFNDWLLLESDTEVTMGRGLGLTYQLVSKQCPLMISRTHCIFRKNEEGTWTVTDNKSLNGVYLNHERLEPSKAYQVYEGDHVQLGVPLKDGERAEYEYELIRAEREKIEHFLTDQLKAKMKVQRTKRKYSACELDPFAVEGSSNSRSKSLRLSWDGAEHSNSSQRAVLATQPTELVEPKLPVAGPSVLSTSQPDCSSQDFEKDELFSTQPVEKAVSCDKGTKSAIAVELNKVREKMLEIRKLKMMVQEKQTKVLSIKQQSKKRAQKQVWEMERQLQELHDQLHSVQEAQLQKIKELEKTFLEEDQHLEGDRHSERDESMKEHLAQALQEHTILMEELDRSKKDFEQIIQAKNKEIQETMEEKEKVQAQKKEVLNQMSDVLDNEMQCIICSEHFIEAVTLNCAHSFCSYCIKEWIKRKVECPICRQEILTQTRSLVLDNCIDRMMENLSHEMKQHRLALIKERKEMKEKPEAAVSPTKSDSGSSSNSSSSILSSMASIMSISSYDSDDFYEENFDFGGIDDYDGYEDSENDEDNYFIL